MQLKSVLGTIALRKAYKICSNTTQHQSYLSGVPHSYYDNDWNVLEMPEKVQLFNVFGTISVTRFILRSFLYSFELHGIRF